MTQQTFFDTGPPIEFLQQRRNGATPALLGSGPDGETCGTCLHALLTRSRGGSRFYKCGVMRAHWTSGAGTDIRLKWPACSHWEGIPKPVVDRSKLRQDVLDAITSAGSYGITVDELSEKWDVPPNAISGRFTELAKEGAIERIGRRKTRTGNAAGVWRAK